MANQDVKSTLNYWIDGGTGTLIKAKPLTPAGNQIYWYNGSTEEYLSGSVVLSKPRLFAILIGF